MKSEWSKISLIFLFLVALIGTLLRSTEYIQIPLDYLDIVHAHSHVAFQGWIYTIMFLFLINTFLTKDKVKKGRYLLQYKLTIIVVIGVLISFTLQGYRLYSIIISTLFQLLNYWFIYQFLKGVKGITSELGNSISLRFVRTGLWLGLLSTLMPYVIGILSVKGLGGAEVYQSFIYTFLHLQYNGWFLFVVLGLFFNFFDKNDINYNQKNASLFYWLLTIAVIPSIALSLLGMDYSTYIMLPAYFAAAVTTAALIFFLKTLPYNLLASLREKSNWFKLYFIAFLGAFILKMILQCLSVLPVFKSFAFFNKFIIMAYLHLSLIGSISFLFIALMLDKKWLPVNGPVKAGSVLLVSGFVTTELMLVLIGLGINFGQTSLAIGSLAMVLGVFLKIVNR